ncbi:uncharacterized protein EV154DRAFT_451365 [Mucor mucedo]|uniref:uncharacterized protein n=1 Tax=Mucor mucedo TaxID=29922 RepID=UPI00221E7622|nr:uncharacterized protein EV154DRAFT_451365 [Mucor mucedo]KAI7876804.1 hypothetical protein EV154DRAFT_451365 [Mucor mucedo]
MNTEMHDFWRYRAEFNTWDLLPSPSHITRCGHTSSMLSDGRLVILGGYHCPTTNHEGPLDLIPMDRLLMYDTRTSIWVDPPQIKGVIPASRRSHSAIVMNTHGDIFICGGQNEAVSPFQIYLGSSMDHAKEMVGILDTQTWTWRTPKYDHIPFPQSFAAVSIINNTKLVYGFGIHYHTVCDHFRVFDISTESWEDPAPIKQLADIRVHEARMDILWVIIACICLAIAGSCGVLIWTLGTKRIQTKFHTSIHLIKREIWKPRIGEPGWAETSRLVLKLLFLFLFIYLIWTLTSQVIHSPIIDQLSFEETSDKTVDVPDMKFCFDDWDQTDKPYIRCNTDFGIPCSDWILPLPTDDDDRICMLFRAPTTFRLGETSERLLSNGSFLFFDYYGPSPNDGLQLQVDVYNTFHNPNVAIYNLSSPGDTFEWNDKYEQDLYVKGRSIQNSHRVNLGVVSTISFQLIKRVSLQPGLWNYAGVASYVKTKYEIETVSSSESFPTMYDPSSGAPQPLGSIHLIPLSCQTRVLREQKAFSLMNAMGIFGGLFGLLFSLQSCLFGYRPRSPWGYMHRWSFGQLRSSLMRGLQTHFFPTQEPLPVYVAPTAVEPTYSAQKGLVINTSPSYLLPASPVVFSHEEREDVRLGQIEDRIHMLERLFGAYYIDDEIFRSLDNALKNDAPSPTVGKSGRKRK